MKLKFIFFENKIKQIKYPIKKKDLCSININFYFNNILLKINTKHKN